MKKLLKTIDKLLTYLSIFFIKLYQYTFSPDKGIFSPILKGRICSHEPHCSQYAIQTLKRYGFRKGIGKATDRVLHCKGSMDKIYDPEHYRIVFFSSAPIGVSFLEELSKDKRFEIVGVVTQADKPVGRGLHIQENVIKAVAAPLMKGSKGGSAQDIQTPLKINPDKSLEGKIFYDRLQAKNPDFLVVIAYGKILSQSILDTAHFGAINVHGSVLPKYR
ncbi:MAG: membrane protein insertion efficiency factor YidD [Candidatus Peribacteria bacterium]|jgi:putative component of membrane protein insertase Oxa1/YidC/SpoIIIJ protein YidD|nr:membrane protein insertion efficiency factor YidD [Candidatus Peribacteria bacterium]